MKLFYFYKLNSATMVLATNRSMIPSNARKTLYHFNSYHTQLPSERERTSAFRIFRVGQQHTETQATKAAQHRDHQLDPRIDYVSRDKARQARRLTTEDPLEAKLREIFRSPKKTSKVTNNNCNKLPNNPKDNVHNQRNTLSYPTNYASSLSLLY